MARRVVIRDTATAYPAAPAESLVPVVERFTTARERSEHSYRRDCPACVGTGDRRCRDRLLVVAWCRWRDTRAAWLAEHEIPRREHCRVWPGARPRWEH